MEEIIAGMIKAIEEEFYRDANAGDNNLHLEIKTSRRLVMFGCIIRRLWRNLLSNKHLQDSQVKAQLSKAC